MQRTGCHQYRKQFLRSIKSSPLKTANVEEKERQKGKSFPNHKLLGLLVCVSWVRVRVCVCVLFLFFCSLHLFLFFVTKFVPINLQYKPEMRSHNCLGFIQRVEPGGHAHTITKAKALTILVLSYIWVRIFSHELFFFGLSGQHIYFWNSFGRKKKGWLFTKHTLIGWGIWILLFYFICRKQKGNSLHGIPFTLIG